MSTLSGSIEGARGSPVEVHEYLASNLHPGRCQVCAPFLMFVNGAIAFKTTVTETQVGASNPVLPTKPERRPRDRASAPGKGTTFTVYLPRVDDAEAEGSLGPVPTRLPRGSETILLVEDEPEVRALTRDVLAQLGYRVLDAADPAEARRLADQQQSAIDLLVTDVVMPQMNGPELAAQLKARSPGLRVLYVSGYTSDAVSSRGISPSDIALLQKPFTPDELARKLREVLDAPASGHAGYPIATSHRGQPAHFG